MLYNVISFFIRWCLILFFGVLVMIAGVGLFLTDQGYLERSITIEAPVEKVFAEVNNPAAFKSWNPWFKIDPDTLIEYFGPAEGVGATLRWRSENPEVGSGTMEIIESESPVLVTYYMSFDLNGKGKVSFRLLENQEQTHVTWALEANLEEISQKYFGLVMEQVIGPQYERGLISLKQKVEN